MSPVRGGAGGTNRRLLVIVAVIGAAVIGVIEFAGAAGVSRAEAGGHAWIAAWAASAQPPSVRNQLSLQGFRDETIREYVFPSVAGSAVRVRFTNRYGTRPLRIGAASIAPDLRGTRDLTRSPVPLSFDGHPSVTVAPGATVTSDPAQVRVTALRELAVSVFLPDRTGPATGHTVAAQINDVSSGDEVVHRAVGTKVRPMTAWFFVDGISVLAPRRVRGVVVVLGDSITDGYRSALGANARWPNGLARRFALLRASTLSVVDAGIAGNRLLTGSPCFGPSALTRFRPDVLAQPGIRDVILLEGTNDIGMSHVQGACSAPHTPVAASQIIAGDRRIIQEAHRHGLAIFGGTLIPFGGSGFWTPAGEATRDDVNRWIRTSRAFDGVIDFARALADPKDPEILAERYDSGDHLHPNDAGYRAMANTVSLATLLRAPIRRAAASARRR